MIKLCPVHGVIDWPVTSVACPVRGCPHELEAFRDQIEAAMAMAKEPPPPETTRPEKPHMTAPHKRMTILMLAALLPICLLAVGCATMPAATPVDAGATTAPASTTTAAATAVLDPVATELLVDVAREGLQVAVDNGELTQDQADAIDRAARDVLAKLVDLQNEPPGTPAYDKALVVARAAIQVFHDLRTAFSFKT